MLTREESLSISTHRGKQYSIKAPSSTQRGNTWKHRISFSRHHISYVFKMPMHLLNRSKSLRLCFVLLEQGNELARLLPSLWNWFSSIFSIEDASPALSPTLLVFITSTMKTLIRSLILSTSSSTLLSYVAVNGAMIVPLVSCWLICWYASKGLELSDSDKRDLLSLFT